MSRRGVALLLALGVVLLLLAGFSVWLAAASRASASVIAWEADARLWAQEQGAESVAIAWLATHGGTLVAPPEGGQWRILDDRWATAGGSGWVSVTVRDGWAGIPPHLAGPRGVLRRSVPWTFTDVELPAESLRPPSQAQSASSFLESVELMAGQRRFPPHHQAPGVTAGSWSSADADVQALAAGGAGSLGTEQDALPALATVFSPHSDGRINLNTAPMPLVEQVIRLHGGLVPGDLRRNRERGIPTTATPDPGGVIGHPVLVDSTGIWNVQITTGWNGWIRSWWVVVAGASPNPRIVQRHAVPP